MFGPERAGLIFAVDEYLDAKEAVEKTLRRRFYDAPTERRFFKAGEYYISKINELHNTNRNGKQISVIGQSNDSVDGILKEILEITLKLHPAHQLKMSKEFPDLLGRKLVTSSL